MIERVKGMPPIKSKAVKRDEVSGIMSRQNKFEKMTAPVKKDPPKAEVMKSQITDRKNEVAKEKDARREKVKGIMDKMGESADLFDIVSTYFIEEGYDKKDVYAAMSSVDLSEEVQDLHEVLPAVMAGIKAVGGLMAKKGIGGVLKTVGAKVGSKIGGSAGRKLGYKAGSAIANNPMTSYMVARDMTSGGGGGGNQQPMMTKRTSTVSAGADLFDIVKGQLLDEGLSEEEIKDIMLTLTPDEILKEMDYQEKPQIKSDVPQDVRDAAKRQYKAGTAKEDPKNPYTTADKKKIINQYKNKPAM